MTNNYMPVKDCVIFFNSNRYFIYEFDGGTDEFNLISIDGNTFYGNDKLDGYVVEANRIDENTFKYDTIWLSAKEMGWSEYGTVDDQEEKLFVQAILKECGIDLILP